LLQRPFLQFILLFERRHPRLVWAWATRDLCNEEILETIQQWDGKKKKKKHKYLQKLHSRLCWICAYTTDRKIYNAREIMETPRLHSATPLNPEPKNQSTYWRKKPRNDIRKQSGDSWRTLPETLKSSIPQTMIHATHNKSSTARNYTQHMYKNQGSYTNFFPYSNFTSLRKHMQSIKVVHHRLSSNPSNLP
jgi:hypothetical protein